MKRRIFQIALLSLGLWLASCSTGPETEADPKEAEQGLTSATDEANEPAEPQMADSDVLPVGASPILGDPSAPITVVAFSDLQCPFCERGARTVAKLQQTYPNEVKVVFKHYVLPFHKQAPAAHKAAIAAGEQGEFWEMHDLLFENQNKFKANAGNMKQWTSQLADQLGLDVEQFQADFDAPETQRIIDRDMELGKEVNVRGTPHFFVNGERVVGAKPLSAFETTVKTQLNESKQMQKDGVARTELYKKMVAENYDGGKPKPSAQKKKPSTPTVKFVPVRADDPMFGNTKDPLVTIVEFSDFQCPFCSKVTPTLDQIKKEYGDQVRVVFKQLPLAMHAQAKPAAQAALAAHQQGKFWEMHDLLFEKQRDMRDNDSNFKEWSAGLAKDLGLDIDQFKKDYDDPNIAHRIEEDLKLASRVGARGTPNFWINGVNLRGAQPFSKFESLIDEQLRKAKKLEADKKLSGDELYKAAVALNETDSPQPAAKKRAPKPTPKVDISEMTLEDAPAKGPADAPVTVVMFSDFQCPYCNKGGKNVMAAADKFEGDVKLIFKHYPLPFHKQAKPAAKAAMAAGEQGKFWEMHDLIFENQKKLENTEVLTKLAGELGLNMAKFKKDMDKAEYDDIIKRDMKEGQAAGVRGTPAFYINGTRITGAQPTHKFEQAIEDALAGDEDEAVADEGR